MPSGAAMQALIQLMRKNPTGRLRRRRLRRQVVQPAGLRGRRRRPPRSSTPTSRASSPTARTTTPRTSEPGLRGLRHHRRRRLRPLRGHRGVRHREPRAALRADRRRGRQRLRRQEGRRERQAAPLRHRAGGVHGRLRGRRLHQDRHRRHVRRPAVPDRDHLHGRLPPGRRVLQRPEGQEGQGRRLGRRERHLHRRLRGQREGHQRRPAARSTRTPTCCCPSVARSTKAR